VPDDIEWLYAQTPSWDMFAQREHNVDQSSGYIMIRSGVRSPICSRIPLARQIIVRTSASAIIRPDSDLLTHLPLIWTTMPPSAPAASTPGFRNRPRLGMHRIRLAQPLPEFLATYGVLGAINSTSVSIASRQAAVRAIG